MDIVWDDEDGIADAVMALYDDGETDSDLETEQDVEEAFPQPRWGGSRIGKLATSNDTGYFTPICCTTIIGVTHLCTVQLTSRSSLNFQYPFLMR